MHSSEKLAIELDKAGLAALAVRARNHEFHDFLSPHATPCLLLLDELTKAGAPAADIRKRHMNGEFDATKAESDAWAASPDGQEAFGLLVSDVLKGSTKP